MPYKGMQLPRVKDVTQHLRGPRYEARTIIADGDHFQNY